MNKTKKNLSILILITLSFTVLFFFLYSFKEARKLTADRALTNSNLETARKKLELENKRLIEMRGKSYAMQVSQEQYLKVKSLVDKTNIFFKDADTLHPQIKIKTKNKTLEDKINARRMKINELLLTWEENNKRFLETDQALISQIQVALVYIDSYVGQLKTIVFGLSAEDSGLSDEQINSFRDVITSSVSEITEVITTVKIAETITKESAQNNPDTNSSEITKQIEIVKQTEDTVKNLENTINNTPANPTPVTTQGNTGTTSTSTSTDTPAGIKINNRPKIVNPEPAIIYRQNPAQYKNTGVDVDTSGQMSPLQDW